MKALSIYLAYFAQFLKSRMAYKGDFFGSLLGTALTGAGGLLFIIFLIDGESIKAIKGWTRDEVLFIYGYSLLATALFSTLAPNLYNFADRYIIQGEFDRILLRPLDTMSQVLFETFNLESLANIFVGLGVVLYAGSALGMTLSFFDVLWLIISSFSGAVILLSVFITLSSMSFHFEDRVGIAPPFYNLINFGRYPLPIFNRLIQFVLSWIVPFGFVAFYPATHFLGREEFRYFCYGTPLMALAFLMLARISWAFGVSRYASTGN